MYAIDTGHGIIVQYLLSPSVSLLPWPIRERVYGAILSPLTQEPGRTSPFGMSMPRHGALSTVPSASPPQS